MTTFCRRSNLVSFLSGEECPALLKNAWAVMQRYLDPKDLDSAFISKQNPPSCESHGSNYSNLDVDIYHAFTTLLSCSRGRGVSVASAKPHISREVLLHSRFHLDGVLYTNFRTNINHSIIYFHRDSHSQSAPAQIRAIFTHKRRSVTDELVEEVFLAIHEYMPADNTTFLSFPDFRAGIFKREPAPVVQVIRSMQIHCHANQRPWDHATVVMRAIDRVRFLKTLVAPLF